MTKSAPNGIDVVVFFRCCCSHPEREKADLQQQLKGVREEEKISVLLSGKQVRANTLEMASTVLQSFVVTNKSKSQTSKESLQQ